MNKNDKRLLIDSIKRLIAEKTDELKRLKEKLKRITYRSDK